MRKLLVGTPGEKTDYVIEHEDALHAGSDGFDLRLQPADGGVRRFREEAVNEHWVLYQVGHEIGEPAHKRRSAQRAARGSQRDRVAGIKYTLLLHAIAVERQRHERIGGRIHGRQAIHVFDSFQAAGDIRRPVGPKRDFGAQS